MKRWPVVIALLYGITLTVLIVPAVYLAFVGSKDEINPISLFRSWQYWVWLAVLMLNQWALLAVPVDVTNKRPASKRSIIFQIAASAFSIGLLIAGMVVGLGEVIKGDASFNYTGWIFFGILGLSWLFWARVFSTWSRKFGPEDLVKRTCQTLFRGSVLQLLIVVPCHIYTRSKDYCCAGYGTAIGLVCGLAVMLVSFGPGIFFLYADHWKKLHPMQDKKS